MRQIQDSSRNSFMQEWFAQPETLEHAANRLFSVNEMEAPQGDFLEVIPNAGAGVPVILDSGVYVPGSRRRAQEHAAWIDLLACTLTAG